MTAGVVPTMQYTVDTHVTEFPTRASFVIRTRPPPRHRGQEGHDTSVRPFLHITKSRRFSAPDLRGIVLSTLLTINTAGRTS